MSKKKAQQAYELLCESIRESFAGQRVASLSAAVDSQKLHTWVDGRIRVLQPGEDAAKKAKDLVNELLWTFSELQIALGHVLFCHDTGLLHRGVDKSYTAKIEIPELNAPDALFWFYVSVTWEVFYRVWSRLENLLSFSIFGIEGPQGSSHLHLAEIVERIKSEKPLIARSKELHALRGLIKDRQMVAEQRNTSSHSYSSLFKKVEHRIEISEIFQSSGEPFYRFNVRFPSPKVAVGKLTKCYYKVDSPWAPAVLKVIDVAAQHSGRRL